MKSIVCSGLFGVLLVVSGCTWLDRYDRAVTLKQIRAEESGSLEKVVRTADPLDVQTAIPPRKGFIAQTGPLSPQEQLKTFALPEDFEIQLVASEPEIHKPMQLAFDERGRLLVSTSTDYPLGPVEGREPADRVMLLEIDGITGAATHVTTYAEGFNICSGLESLPGGRVVLAHAPDVLLLTDSDGDGAADSRETLFTGFARDDTHEIPNSFTWGIDGWVYGLQGHVNVSNVKDKSNRVTPIHHGKVFRMRPDGSQIEVWARGMSNPWGLTFDHRQNMFAADCESRPLWQIVRGLPYQGFLQAPDPLGFAPFITEDPHGASGFAGLVCYSDNAFPEEYQNCLYLGNPITGRIHRDRPTSKGLTEPVVRRPDFLVSTDPWFRPVDIELGPDGALYVADWYNSVIAHVEVPLDHPSRDKTRGRIWRIVYRGEDSQAAARQFEGPMARNLAALEFTELVTALGEPNGWVRRMASAQIRARFPREAIDACRRILLGKADSAVQRMEALWLLQLLDALPQSHAEALARDPDPRIRREAVRIIAGRPKTPARTYLLVSSLSDSSPHVVCEAAMALRDKPSESSLNSLLDSASKVAPDDTLLRYALRFAARDHLLDQEVIAKVDEKLDASEHKATLRELLAAAPSPQAAGILAREVASGDISEELLPLALENIFANGTAEVTQQFLSATLDSGIGPAQKRLFAAMLFKNREHVAKIGIDPGTHLKTFFAELANASDKESRVAALEIAAGLNLDEGIPLAREVLRERSAPLNSREKATYLLMRRDAEASASAIRGVIANPTEPVTVRRTMAREYAKYVNDATEFTRLTEALKTAPLEVYGGAVESLVIRKPAVLLLLEAVENGSVSSAHINNHVTRIRIENTHKDPALTARYDRLVERAYNAENEGDISALSAQLLDKFRREPERNLLTGRRVFEENCVKCHRMGGQGALIGPNLDGLANRGIERVLQDVLSPSLDIDPAFRTTDIALYDGETVSGLVTRETSDQIVMADAQGQERIISKQDISKRTKLLLSPMPSGLAAAIPEGDFLDLLGYLLNPAATTPRLGDQ